MHLYSVSSVLNQPYYLSFSSFLPVFFCIMKKLTRVQIINELEFFFLSCLLCILLCLVFVSNLADRVKHLTVVGNHFVLSFCKTYFKLPESFNYSKEITVSFSKSIYVYIQEIGINKSKYMQFVYAICFYQDGVKKKLEKYSLKHIHVFSQ